MLLKHCTQWVSTFRKPRSGYRNGKGQSSSQFPRWAVLKNVQNTTIGLISHASKVMLKILQEFPDAQVGFRKGKGTRDQIANIHWIIEKAWEFQKNSYLCFIDYTKPFDCVDHNKLWEALKKMGMPDHLTCLLRNLYVGQEATVRTTDWFRLRKEYDRAVYCHHVCLTYMHFSYHEKWWAG